MAELSTVARPYAQAAFDLAQEKGNLKEWSEMLRYAAVVAADDNMQALLDNPAVGGERVEELFLDICGDRLDELAQNFIRLLARNRRLALLPEIASQFEVMRAEAEGSVEAEVTSAFALTDAQKQELAAGLKKRFGREVNLVTHVDESLLGGAVVRVGDTVIDGSAAEQLNRLANVLRH